jgi:hypothetical protein
MPLIIYSYAVEPVPSQTHAATARWIIDMACAFLRNEFAAWRLGSAMGTAITRGTAASGHHSLRVLPSLIAGTAITHYRAWAPQ